MLEVEAEKPELELNPKITQTNKTSILSRVLIIGIPIIKDKIILEL
jgi:hypothetical protein